MDNDELFGKFMAAGHRLDDPVINSDGMLVLRIDDTAMFRRDAVELVIGRATLAEIVKRNRRKNLP